MNEESPLVTENEPKPYIPEFILNLLQLPLIVLFSSSAPANVFPSFA